MSGDARASERAPAGESWTSLLVPVALILGLALLLSLPAGAGPGKEMPTGLVAVWVERIVGYLAAGVEIAAALVVGVAVLRSVTSYLRQLVGRGTQQADTIEAIRQRLGRVLALGLELTIASDILRTGGGANPGRHHEPRCHRAAADPAQLFPRAGYPPRSGHAGGGMTIA